MSKILRELIDGLKSAPETIASEVAAVKESWEGLRIGDGHASAMARLGGHELTQILQAFPESNVKPIEEPGIFGNTTPQIVTEQITGQERGGRD